MNRRHFQILCLACLGAAVYRCAPTPSQAVRLPEYRPGHLRPIAWPANSPGPGFHSADHTWALDSVGRLRIAIQRAAAGWGTGYVDEWYSVYHAAKGELAESLDASGPGDRVKLWTARSYHREWLQPNSPDTWAAAGCFFVADDSLLAYGVVLDRAPQAQAFAGEERLLGLAGYYRYRADSDAFVKIANLRLEFHDVCRAQLKDEERGLGGR